MRVLAVTNLLPRPDEPTRGMYNAQTLEHLVRQVELDVIGLVPEWRPWMWAGIRRYVCPHPALSGCTRYIPAIYVPRVGRDRNWHTYEWSMLAVRDHFLNADVIFSSWLYPDGVAATRLAAAYGKPSWMMALGSDTFHLEHRLRRRAIVRASRDAAGIICVCQLLADRLAAAGVERAKLHVVPNGVDTDLFHFRPKADALTELQRVGDMAIAPALSDGNKIILFVGNLVPVKGPDLMLDAFARLVNSHTHTLVFIGDGPMRGALEDKVRRKGLSNCVHFVGRRPHDEIALWMNVADCLCLSSRSEGMPNVMLEALASGLPVAAADVGACRELLAAEPLGRVVDWRHLNDATTATAALEEAGEKRRELSQRHGSFTWQKQAGQIRILLDKHRSRVPCAALASSRS